jgi:serine/threonine protein kinase
MPGAGRYHISRKIADGGMAEIFLGRQRGVEGFERPVVLKRILASFLADPQFRNQMIDTATSFRSWISAMRRVAIFSSWSWWKAGTSTKS